MYEKVMKIPDELIIRYYDLTTDLHPDDIAKIQQRLKNGENPRNIKMELAKEIVRLYHGSDLAQQAEEYFVATYQKNVFSDQTPVIKLAPEHFTPNGNLYVVELLFSTGKYKSKGEIRRLIQGGAVKLNGEKLFELETTLPQTDEIMLQVGKGTLFKVEK